MLEPENIEVYDVYHLPIIKAYADRIDLVNTINHLVPSKMDIDPGTLVLAMVLDALSGRHPLYRIESFFKTKDIELLLGQSIAHEKLTDVNFGRLLDMLYEANTTQLYSAIVINALRGFEVPTKHIRYDTTSMTVFGQYNSEDPESPKTIKITKGYSKDHRPDLNQFVVSLLCTGGNVPIFSKLEDGVASTAPTRNRPGVHYRGYETTATLCGRTYRAIVVHSSAHDRRRQKRLDREVEQERCVWGKKLSEVQKTLYFCTADARQAMAKLRDESPRYHDIELTMEERPLYARGRPKADGSRTLKEMRYAARGKVQQKPEAISMMRDQAGCFVLITNVPVEGPPNSATPYNGKTILKAYKEQNGIEHNFSFLKDPVLVNSIFLKQPERIEASGLIFVISLLLWRLIELNMRSHLEIHQGTVPGWDNKPKARPTTFMMTTKFDNIRITKIQNKRALNGRLSQVQEKYLVALGLTAEIFTHIEGFHPSQ